MSKRIYRLTEAGRNAWESQEAAVPADYRRLLWLMDFHGHAGLSATSPAAIRATCWTNG